MPAPARATTNFRTGGRSGLSGTARLRYENGTPVENGPWIHQLDPRQNGSRRSLILLERAGGDHRDSRRACYAGPEERRPPPQAWRRRGHRQAPGRLAAHLDERRRPCDGRATHSDNQCASGFRGRFFEVGFSAAQIWKPAVAGYVEMLTQARCPEFRTGGSG